MSRVLEVHGLHAGYAGSEVLFDVSLHLDEGEVVTLMGRNGMGKSTTLKCILGLVKATAGSIRVYGEEATHLPSHRIARMGLGYVPEGRQIFPSLSVRENLLATAANRRGNDSPWDLDRVLDLFPRLGERLAQSGQTLSGGEQQMLAIGRALMTNPRLLVLDEATEGLAPLIREEIWHALEHKLKLSGQAILLVDQHPNAMARIADRHYVMEKGRIVWSGDSDALLLDELVQEKYLGV